MTDLLIDEAELAEIEALCEKATVGEGIFSYQGSNLSHVCLEDSAIGSFLRLEDAQFDACAREVLPRATATIRSLRAALETIAATKERGHGPDSNILVSPAYRQGYTDGRIEGVKDGLSINARLAEAALRGEEAPDDD